jgi:methyl-accepting chemotaxis protein
MAQTIQLLAGSSDELVKLSASLTAGAHEVVSRNERLRGLATENRARLDESSSSLETLAAEVQTGAAAVDRLAEASAEVRTFVVLVQKLARQSKLLALNAAMEAARAGEHGEGFAVVASEVRRLSAMSSDAAERTQQIVADVLSGIEQSRASSQRAVATVQGVREATDHGSQSFAEIERAVAEAKEWTASVEQTVTAASALANDVRSRLDTLAQGTESFAAAMEEVAASSEEQSASTEEIAAAASTLASAAERLSKIVAGLRLEVGEVVAEESLEVGG